MVDGWADGSADDWDLVEVEASGATGFELRRLTPQDYEILARWLRDPRVSRWWNHDTSPEGIQSDFGPATRGEEPCEDLLVSLGGVPIGLVQRYALAAYPEDRDTLARYVEVPDGAWGIDYLVGEPAYQGRGVGPRMIAVAVAELFATYADATCVLVPVVAANRASWRALQKAGFRRVGEGDMTPDNPVDDPWHVISRRDRPFGLPAGSR